MLRSFGRSQPGRYARHAGLAGAGASAAPVTAATRTVPLRMPGFRLAGGWLDVALCLALLGVALWVRLPYLLDVPGFTDETDEVRRAVLVARGQLLPLTDVD